MVWGIYAGAVFVTYIPVVHRKGGAASWCLGQYRLSGCPGYSPCLPSALGYESRL